MWARGISPASLVAEGRMKLPNLLFCGAGDLWVPPTMRGHRRSLDGCVNDLRQS